jgi:hypothetical protein
LKQESKELKNNEKLNDLNEKLKDEKERNDKLERDTKSIHDAAKTLEGLVIQSIRELKKEVAENEKMKQEIEITKTAYWDSEHKVERDKNQIIELEKELEIKRIEKRNIEKQLEDEKYLNTEMKGKLEEELRI